MVRQSPKMANARKITRKLLAGLPNQSMMSDAVLATYAMTAAITVQVTLASIEDKTAELTRCFVTTRIEIEATAVGGNRGETLRAKAFRFLWWIFLGRTGREASYRWRTTLFSPFGSVSLALDIARTGSSLTRRSPLWSTAAEETCQDLGAEPPLRLR
jgi:hypothetical protein